MQIRSNSLSNYSYLPSPESRRDRAVEAPAAIADGGERESRPREVTRIARGAAAASAEQLAGFAPQVRGALQSYLSNGPSLSERYGVELAGVDIFV